MPGLSASEKRVLNPRPLRHYRRTYSITEFRIGLAVLAILTGIGAWIVWRRAHPADPLLFADPSSFLDPGAKSAGRGDIPPGLTAAGWREGPVTRFSRHNLYEKIDGRADYFLSRGFKSLSCVTLQDGKAAATAVDLELYDLGSAQNALSAFSGEKSPGVEAKSENGSSWYVARNALFLARGPYYARAIGSDEGPAVLAALEKARGALTSGLAAGDPLWAHALFGGALGLAPDKVTYQAENAFSFGFAKGVQVAQLPDGDTEMFVAPARDEADARALAQKFEGGFLSYGAPVARGGAKWVKDNYLGSFARAASEGDWVVGVRGATDPAAAEASLEKLRKALAVLPPNVHQRALKELGNPAGAENVGSSGAASSPGGGAPGGGH